MTLSEINITPLLDLAFVLLIIFMITTPMLEQSINLNLPKGGNSKVQVRPQDILTVEASLSGEFKVAGRRVGSDRELEDRIVAANQSNPNTVIRIRLDENSKVKLATTVLDICERHGITRISFASDPKSRH